MKALHIIIYIVMMAVAPAALALPADTYAPNSVLASGRWVQVSVSESGVHRISATQLAQWGFRDPKKVRIHGYGGERISDVLSADTYVDDLPAVQSVCNASGVTFYAVGPTQVTSSTGGMPSHQVNPYSNYGYYYITESDSVAAPAIESGSDPYSGSDTPASSALVLLVHEQETTSPGAGGRMMVGEDFAYTRTRSFDFDLSEREPGSEVYMRCSFVASAPSSSSLRFTVNGAAIPTAAGDRIDAVSDGEVYGNQTVATHVFTPSGSGSTLRLGVTYSANGSVTRANLDYLEIIFRRKLSVPRSGSLTFTTTDPTLKIDGSGATVWDVTDPSRILAMNLSASGVWHSRYSGTRRYVAFGNATSLPSPRYVGTVSNQNLHALSTPDMVIITPTAYSEAARRLAEVHRTDAADPLTVEVVTLDKVLHEFGSGAFDPGAIRRFLKMLYDRGPLRFALLMGKGTYDNRALTGVGRNMRAPMPLWQSEASLSESAAYSTDDIMAFLEDNSGLRFGYDKLSVALGRIPCTTTDEARVAVDKIIQYRDKMPRTDWRNHVLMLADDGNEGVHMTQSETFHNNMTAPDGGTSMMFTKVYIDAYNWQNSSYPEARQQFYRSLNDGAMLWVYVGHGSPTALCGDNMVTYVDFSTQFFLRHWPFCYAATCSFLKWDTDQTSAAEMLYFTPDGGLVGVISALRPVYISYNGNFTAAFGAEFADRDEQGRFRTIGEVYQRAKNRLSNDTNRLRYVFMGDPALRLAIPSARVRLDSVGSQAVTPDAQVCLPARGRISLSGSVLGTDGQVDTGFNGRISATLYDADVSRVSLAHGDDGAEVPFDVHGDMLLTTIGKVTGGRFSINVQMPVDIADNFRPASLNLYAYSDSAEASGVCRDLYVWGYDETTPDDITPPVIHSMALNHSNFTDGSKVHSTPMLLASVSDDTGINLSSAGVGHQIAVTVDGSTSYFDVSGYFTPDLEPTAGAMSGTIAYPMPAMKAGRHTVRLRVWDLAGNVAERSVECVVDPELSPKMLDVYTDANPATTSANFYVTHNRPDERVTVSVTVYNLLGRAIWTGSVSGRSDMHTSIPLRWDLTDNAGRRVSRGIYLYRATVTDADGTGHASKSRKIAVSGN